MTVNNSSSLDLTSGMTLEGWVKPSALGNAYRAVIFREQPGNEVYSLYADQSGSQFPTGEVYVNGYKDANGTAVLPLNSLDAPGRDLRRLLGAPLRQRDARFDHRGRRLDWPARPRRFASAATRSGASTSPA